MQFYSGKKVLVTGGASFIGSHLVDKLVSLDAKVTVVDDFSSGTIDNLAHVKDNISLIEGDLRSQEVAHSVTKDQEVVFHLANAHGGRGYIETHPAEISQNMLIDNNVFFASYKNNIDRVCFFSSACVYPTNLQDKKSNTRYLSEEMASPFTKGAALADGEYGWAKLMGEMALKAYNKQYGMKGVSCRLFTVYGPRENETHAIIALIAKSLLKQDPYEIWGSGEQDRNFTYVDDIVEGVLRATEKISDCSAINIGTDQIIKIKDAARIICELTGHKPAKIFFDTSKPEGVHARAADTKRQLSMLSWKPRTSFEKGIKKTIDWYQKSVNISDLSNSLESKLFER